MAARGSPAAAIDPSRPSSVQAALASIWVTLLGLAPLIWMRRGFMASGISRCRSIDEQAVLEARTLDLDVVERELALEIARRDAAMQEGLLFLFALSDLEREDVCRRSARPRPA